MPTYTAKYLITDVIPPPYAGGPYNKTTINIAGHDWVQIAYQLADKGINKYVLQGLVDVSTLHGNERFAHVSWDPVGTTFYSLYDQTIGSIADIPAEYRLGASSTLADGWWGTNNAAGSGDFLWSSPTTATYNLKTSLTLPGVRDIVAYGLNFAGQYVLGEAASTLGVAPLWDAVQRVDSVKTALTDFVNGGADTLTQLLNGFNTGMTLSKQTPCFRNSWTRGHSTFIRPRRPFLARGRETLLRSFWKASGSRNNGWSIPAPAA